MSKPSIGVKSIVFTTMAIAIVCIAAFAIPTSWLRIVASSAGIVLKPADDAVLSPTAPNGKILFSSGRAPGSASNLKIHRMNADGSGVTCLMCGTGDTRIGRTPAISPDGTTIAYVDGASPTSIRLMNADGTNDRVLTNGASPAWSPQSDRILFTRNIATPTPHNELFIISTNGSGEAPLNDSPTHNNVLPVWSIVTPAFPEGRIAFRSSRDGNSEIYVIAPTAGQNFQDAPQVNVTNNPATDSDPAWSPDGTKLAFQSDRFQTGALAEMYTMEMNPNPGSVTRLTNDGPSPGGFQDSTPVWAPDGTKIAYVSFRGSTEIIVINSANGAPIEPPAGGNITNNPAIDFDVDWAPGTATTPTATNGKIVYQQGGRASSEIYTITPGSGVSTGLRRGYHPAYSPDGTKIAFVDNTPGATNGFIMLMNADGTNVRPLATPRQGFTPTWSPDLVNPRLAFIRGDFASVGDNGKGQLFVIDMTSGSEGANETLIPTTEQISKPTWGGSNRIAAACYLPRVGGGIDPLGICTTTAIPPTAQIASNPPTITRISGTNTNDRDVSWSADGNFLAFISTRDYPMATASEIYQSNAAGTSVLRTTTVADFKTGPAWSPDGQKIVYSRNGSQGPNNATLRSVDASTLNGANPAIITNFGSGDAFPNWGSLTTTPVDLRMESVVSTNPVVQGDNYTYTFSILNLSQAAATGVKIVFDPIPLGIRPVPVQTNCSMAADRRVTCTGFNDIAGGMFGTGIQINFVAEQAGATTVTATVSANQPDPVPNNNSRTFTTTILAPGADLSVSLINLSTETPSVDRELSYKVWLRNQGPQASSNTSLRIAVPSNTFLITPITGCTRVGTGRNYDCAVGSMGTGTERFFDVRVRPTAPGPITLFARVTSDSPDATTDDRSVSRSLQVSDVARPPNDNLANAQPLTGERVNVTGFNVNATIERANGLIDSLGELKHAGKAAGKSVWYLWQAPNRRGSVKISTAGSTFDTLLDVREFSGSPLPVVADNDDAGSLRTSEVSFRYTPGAAYYIAVDGYSGATGDITLKLDVTPFLFLSDPINQKITGFSPASACSVISNLNDLFCGYKREPATGFLLLTIRGENFIPASKVLVDGQQPQGFDLNGNPATGTTTFISSTELLVRVPPNPPLLVERVAKAGVHTPVDVTSGYPDGNAPSGTVTAIAGQTAQIKVLDLKDATLAPGQTARVCGATLFNDPNVETCIEMVHFGPGSATVSPTWFAALAYCRGVETDTDRKLQCAESMSNGRGWAVNPRPGLTPPGSIQFNTIIEVPYGLAPPAGIAPLILGTGGMPAGLITDCSYCSTLIGNDGGTLIGNDGSTIIGENSSGLVGDNGSTLIGNDGSTIIGENGSGLVSNGSGTLIGNDGSTRADVFGPNLMRRNALTGQGPTRPALPRSPGDLVTGNTGFTVIKGSGGSQPTVTYTSDDVTGRAYMTVSITLDNTSTPRASSVGNMAFTVGLNPGVLKLQSSAITVNENAAFATVTVQRSGDTSAPASFEYTTVQNSEVTSCTPGSSSGNGGEKCDYATTLGAFRFAANETTTNIRIPIIDDTYAEGSETFKLFIGNALGAAIELPSAATITITDNDAVSGPANPLDTADAQFFVRQQYLDLLGREPSSAEMTAGTGPITQCGADAACRKTKTVDLSNALFVQAQPAAGYVFRLYRAAFGNEQPFPLPDTSNPVEAKKWVNYSAFSRDLALLTEAGQSLTQKQVELANSFVLRRAFTRKYSPVTLINGPAFVDAVLATIRNDLGVDLVSQRTILISAFEQSETLMEGRAAVMYRLADASQTNPVNNAPFVTAEDTRSFASAIYNGYLKRDGTIAELNSLLAQLLGGSDRRGFIDQFVTGSDYRLRFGPANAQASVIVSGRVVTPSGQALRNAVVSLIPESGVRRVATTSSFGLFSFSNVPNGANYTVSIVSKRYRFAPRIISVNGDANLGDLVGLE